MSFHRSQFSILAAVLAAAITAACGGTGVAQSPAGPSNIGGSAGATISGQINGSASTSLTASSFHTLDSHGVMITVVGTGISTTANAQGQFTLINVPPGTVQLNFNGPGSNATITISGVGQNDQVQITVTVNGSSARIDSEHHSSPDNNGEFTGRITAIDLASLSFNVGSVIVKVPASAVIRHGNSAVPFAALKIGDQVEVRGTRNGSTITATEIKVESGTEDDTDVSSELQGAVSAVAGTCPSITFFVQATKVTTASTTSYDHGSCASVQNGTRVEVKGSKQPDGSVTAARVSIDD